MKEKDFGSGKQKNKNCVEINLFQVKNYTLSQPQK